jgi:hypothetical protein
MDHKSESMVRIVCLTLGITKDDILGKNRLARVAKARHVCIWLLRDTFNMTLATIGAIFNRDHSTIVHSLKQVDGMLYTGEITDVFMKRMQNKYYNNYQKIEVVAETKRLEKVTTPTMQTFAFVTECGYDFVGE